MAFPVSPSDGDFYNGYEYNSTKSAWQKRETKDWVVKWSGDHASSVSNSWGTGLYKVLVGYNPSVQGGMTFPLNVEDLGPSTFYTGKFINNNGSVVGAEHSPAGNVFKPANTGDYATGGLLKIWRWE